jgi:seryl-tRNA synthetase
MLDIKTLKKDPSLAEKKLQSKDPEASCLPALALYEKICETKALLETHQATLNTKSKLIGEAKRKGEDIAPLTKNLDDLKESIRSLSSELEEMEKEYQGQMLILPNLPDDDIKVSLDPKENVCIKEYKKKPQFSFPIKNHLELGELHDLFDFPRAAKISGSGWPIYKGKGALIEWALLRLMIDIHIKNGFTPLHVPLLVRPEILEASGQLPKFEKQLFKLHDEDYHLYLIPTSEVAINGYHYDEILEQDSLPLKYISVSPCFRREAGAAGSKERGLIRVHQFNKVEMFCFTTPEESSTVFDMMCRSAEEVLETLGLHYRNMCLVTGDMSFAAARTVDIEVWLPGQDRYYEVSSVSNCTDFQSRRSKIRARKEGEKPYLVHTLNGSGLATSRLMVALLENNQQEDGTILLPKGLQPYLNGFDSLRIV